MPGPHVQVTEQLARLQLGFWVCVRIWGGRLQEYVAAIEKVNRVQLVRV